MPTGEFGHLVAAAAVFLGIHVIPSSMLRGVLVARLGEAGYAIAFSVLSIVGIIWLVAAFNAAPAVGMLWYNAGTLQYLTAILVFLATLLVVAGLTQRNPTAVGAAVPADDDPAKGFLRISRHPFLMGVTLWAIAHLIVRGDGRAIVLFGTFGLLAGVGTLLIDAKKRRQAPETWPHYEAKTSILPFLAILGGRNRLAFGELGLWRPALAIVVFVGLLHAHPGVIGVPPLP